MMNDDEKTPPPAAPAAGPPPAKPRESDDRAEDIGADAHEPVEVIGADPHDPNHPEPPRAPRAEDTIEPDPPAARSEPGAAAASAPAAAPTTDPPASERAVIVTQPSAHEAGTRPPVVHTTRSPGLPPELAAQLTVPNILTSTRALLVLVIAVLLLWPWGPFLTGAFILFVIAAATDWLDGRIARAWNVTTDLGRMLDHIADKLLVGITMLCLCANGTIDGVNAFAAALILGRELVISGLREHLSAKGMVIPASMAAKWKTAFQLVALAALMAAPLAPIPEVARVAGLLILWFALALTLVSGAQYVWATRNAWNER